MKLLCLTDLHGNASALQRILEDAGDTDRFLLGGDITHFGTPDAAEALVSRARRAGHDVLAVAGNCDSPEIDQRLAELDAGLFSRGVIRDGVGFFGVSAMPPWTDRMYELTEEQIAKALVTGQFQVAKATRYVVLSHCPPRNTRLDLTHHGEHVGSTSLRSFIERFQPALVVCGHIHEARGVEDIGDTRVVNCGTARDGHYALIELDHQIDVQLCTAEVH